MSPHPQQLADCYHSLLQRILREGGCAEEDALCEIPGELEVQALWHSGLLGNTGRTMRHGEVRILDYGEWNRGPGPDFLRAEIEIDGARMRGDIEIDPTAEDWERHGHGANPDYTQVILHVVLTPPPAGWYTRNEQHIDIPILHIPHSTIREAINAGPPLPKDIAGHCRRPLADKPLKQIEYLLQGAAAYRAQLKRRTFRRKADVLGEQQTWFEALAGTLGYAINKLPMQLLARRAPLNTLRQHAEGILLGTAGFLVPILPSKCDRCSRDYHRKVWDAWWPQREQFELSGNRHLPWRFAPLRPANHPHRRVAALALIAMRWKELSKNLCAANAKELTRQLTTLHHPYWSERCSLPSAPLNKRVALVGEQRVKDFLINHVYVLDEAPFAWQTYISLRSHDIPGKVRRTAQLLFGDRSDLENLLHMMYAQQALLQIDADFCGRNSCRDCLFPEQLAQWCFHPSLLHS